MHSQNLSVVSRCLTAAWFMVLPFVLTACGGDDDGASEPTLAEQLGETGVGRYLGIEPASMHENGTWEEYAYDVADEQAICLEGTEFHASLHRGASKNLLIYLEGGGACWNYQTCYATPLAKTTSGPVVPAGALDPDNEDNPFKDWNIVYGSYCDGSVWSGYTMVDYQGEPTYHHGVQNLSATVTLAVREFPDPDLIVVSGSSAGGYGTYTGYAVTRVAYPSTPILVLNDSGPGLQNPDDPQAAAERVENWHFTDFVPASCSKCATQYTYLTEWALQRDPTLRAGYFSFLQDAVIRFFTGLSADNFEALLRNTTDDIHGQFPDRFKRFFVNGDSHTILEFPSFYSLASDGTTVRDWTAGFITNGSPWTDLVEP